MQKIRCQVIIDGDDGRAILNRWRRCLRRAGATSIARRIRDIAIVDEFVEVDEAGAGRCPRVASGTATGPCAAAASGAASGRSGTAALCGQTLQCLVDLADGPAEPAPQPDETLRPVISRRRHRAAIEMHEAHLVEVAGVA